MSKVHKNRIRKVFIFFIIVSFILCVTCNSYERASYFFASSLPVSTSFYHTTNSTVTEILNPRVQFSIEQGVIQTIETTSSLLVQQPSHIRTSNRTNRLSPILLVLFLLFLSYLGLCTLLLGFTNVHQKTNYSLLITRYIQQLDGKNIMNQIIITIITILFGLIGGLTSLYLLLSIPAIIIFKIFRCVKYGKSMYD